MNPPNTNSRPFSLLRLDHVVLRTTRPEEQLAFYEAIGCELIRAVEKLGLYQLRAGDSLVDLLDVSKQGSAPPIDDGRNMEHFALRIEPFEPEALKDFLGGLSDDVTEIPIRLLGADGYGHSFYVKDVDGNTVELKGPPTEDQTPPEL